MKKFADGSEGTMLRDIAQQCEPEVYKMYADAVQQEKDWATYLFSEGSVIGLNAQILGEYVEYIANKRMRTIGLKGPYAQTSNPLPWTDSWIGSKDTQVAPQEEEITSYTMGGINNNINKSAFSGFTL